ncbi:MAG: TolC family protein [Bacteroidota bacterium]
MKRILFVPIFLFFVGGLSAQKIWSLKDCIAYAYENNIQIKQSTLNTELNKNSVLQSKSALLPSINANANNVYNYGRAIDPFTNGYTSSKVQSNSFYLQSSVTIFGGFKNINAIKQAQYEYLASKYNLDKMRNDISLNIALAYLQVLYSQELLEVAKNQVVITAEQIKRTELLVKVGTLPNGSLLDVQSQGATEELQQVNAQNQLDIAVLNLKQLLDIDPAEAFDIEKPKLNVSENMLTGTSTDIFSKAVANQPEIKSAELSLKSSLTSLSIARGALLPSLQLSGSMGTAYSNSAKSVDNVTMSGVQITGVTASGESVFAPKYDYSYITPSFNKQTGDNLNKSVGLYLSIPIFNGLQVRNNISRAKIGKLNADLNLQLAQNQLRKTIEQAYVDALAGMKKYQATEKSVTALEESFRYTQQRFDIGMLNSTDYNVAKNNLNKSRSDLLQAKYDYIFRVKVLDFYQGNPLVLE